MSPIARDTRHIPDHMPCQCGHMGWRHEPTSGRCARCECAAYERRSEPLPFILQPRRVTQRRIHRPPA